MSVTEQQIGVEETPSDTENDNCTNLSTILTTTSLHKDSLKKKRIEIAELRERLKNATNVAKVLENKVQNLEVQIQEIQDTCTFIPEDCCQVYSYISDDLIYRLIMFPLQIMIASNSTSKTGLYEIKDPCAGDREFIDNYAKMHVHCDMETDGGGWIVIQRRNANINGTVNFTRNWEDYENGFGDLDGEFWIGLRNMHELTNKQEVELQVSVWNDDDDLITWNYPTFSVGDADSYYRLTLRGGTGDGDIDAVYLSNGHYFSTFDRDYSSRNCAISHKAGWWYYYYRYYYINGHRYRKYCSIVNLNGLHKSRNLPDNHVARLHWATPGNTFTNTEMKIRRTTCGLG